MKYFFLAVALLAVSSVAQAQKLTVDAMVSMDKDFEKVAVSVVSKPVVSLGLGKLKVDGVVLPSMLLDKDGTNWEPALGMGAIVHVKKLKLGYSAFKKETEWTNYFGLVVNF